MLEDKNSFMGFNYPYEKSRAVVIQAPYQGTSTYRKGQALGPKAIIHASNQVETYDIELKDDFIDKIGFNTLKPLKIQKLSVSKAIEQVYKTTKKVLEDKKFPIIFGGEHSISLGPIKASKEFFSKIEVLQIDAHADMRKNYMGSEYNHACVMARVREICPVVSVGIRSYSKQEAEIIEKNYKEYFYGPEIGEEEIKKILQQLKNKVYITIDVDGFDPAIIPATGTPEPGGLGWNETLKLLKQVCTKKEVVGFDIVELAPIVGENYSEFSCAKLAYKLAGYCLLKPTNDSAGH
ncbi:MAG: agmatinase [Candidatus Micrarchaeota archaeon]|nr:agmatinase [Candidatus Micrarchaeota archaeon]